MPFLAVNNDVTRRDWNFVPVHESERIVRKTEEKVKTAFDDIYIYIYIDCISTTVDTSGAV